MRETFYSFLGEGNTNGDVINDIFYNEGYLCETRREVEDYVSWYRERGSEIRIVRVTIEVEVEE